MNEKTAEIQRHSRMLAKALPSLRKEVAIHCGRAASSLWLMLEWHWLWLQTQTIVLLRLGLQSKSQEPERQR